MSLTILFLPGLLCDASIFEAQVAALRPHADVVVADFSREDSLQDMARAALALRPGPLVVIGHSMGARVAFEMVRMAPERIARLALLDTGIHPRREGEEAARQELVDLAFRDGMAALARRWLPPMVAEERVGDEALMAGLTDMVLRATPEQHARQIRALLGRPDARPLLPGIACPTLVVVGRQDRWSPPAQNREIADAIPGARFEIVEQSGHMAPAEQPEAVTRLLLDWLGLAEATVEDDRLPDTMLFERRRSLQGYRLNKMAMGLSRPENRAAFLADEEAYLTRFGLSEAEKQAVRTRNWREMVRLGGNLFFILKISAVDPVRITEIGAHQAGMNHATFLRERLGKT